ncbi:hypothetical protein JVT61DRAFT_1664 [Boletus reticuloceps]|uniref:Uncharacterized protein n=1 Tax=Boletus reticuloceps TaxID=495285 RepID=A0A8I2YSR7_9AGAM|nr:hypothetical protein JVT61DRAFT_1664 [Boletus reticuloceps]
MSGGKECINDPKYACSALNHLVRHHHILNYCMTNATLCQINKGLDAASVANPNQVTNHAKSFPIGQYLTVGRKYNGSHVADVFFPSNQFFAMSNQANFRLHGHRLNQLGECKFLLLFLATYNLITGHASPSTTPKAYLWYDSGCQGYQPHAAPGPPHLLSMEVEQLDELQDDVGNITLDSIKSLSIPSLCTHSHIPDIFISCKVSFIRPQSAELPQLSRRVTYISFPLLAELKASSAHYDSIQTSLFNAIWPMSLAHTQVMKETAYIDDRYKMRPSSAYCTDLPFHISVITYSNATPRMPENISHVPIYLDCNTNNK